MRGLVLLVPTVVAVGWSYPCSELQHTQMQAQFSSCRTNYTNQYHNRNTDTASDGPEGGLCTLLNQILDICGDTWNQCHSAHEINKMKDMHTEAFIQHWQDSTNFKHCSTVRKFRESLRTSAPEGDYGGCTDEASQGAMNRFQTCSHGISSSVYGSILEVEGAEAVVAALCRGLHDISVQCPAHLKPCFAPDDVKEMKRLHIQEMTKFFLRLVEDKVEPDALDHCEDQLTQVPIVHSTTELYNRIQTMAETHKPSRVHSFPETMHPDPETMHSDPETIDNGTYEDEDDLIKEEDPDDRFDEVQRLLGTTEGAGRAEKSNLMAEPDVRVRSNTESSGTRSVPGGLVLAVALLYKLLN